MLDMTEGNSAKILVTFAIPMILGNVFQQLYNIVDSVIVGKFVGEQALASVGTAFPIVFLVVAVAIGLTMGCSTVISQLFGAKDERLKSAVYTSLVFLGIIALVLTGVSLVVADPLLRLINTPASAFADASAYIKIFFGGLIFTFFYNGLAAIFRALGDSKTPLYFLIISTLLNIVLDYTFVVYFAMGVPGVAWATLISQGVSGLLCLLYVIKKVPVLHMSKEDMVFNKELYSAMLRYGIPSTVQQAVVSFGMVAIQGLVNSFGTVVMAGYTASTKIDQIAMMPIMNLSMGLSTFVAQNLGAGKQERVKEGYRVTLLLSFGCAALVTLVIYTLGNNLMSIFVDPAASAGVIAFGTSYLRVVSPFYLVMSIMFTANGVMRGAGDVNAFMIITILNLIIRVAASYMLAGVIGQAAIFWALPIGWSIAAVISSARYFSGAWKNKTIVESVGGEA